MGTKKSVLIVNYDFPPAGGAGIKRCLKFMKYLPEYGWKMAVLTVRGGNHHIIDHSLKNEVSDDVIIHRAFTFESLFKKPPENLIKDKVRTSGKIDKASKASSKNILENVYDSSGKFFKIPDSRVLWMPGAFVVALKLIIKRQFDVIYSTGPTFVNFILGAIIKIISRKTLVVDFRDAWLADPMLIDNLRWHLLKLNQILEKFVINYADKVITTNPFVTRDFQKRYSHLNPEKFLTIYNGYDMDDFSSIRESGNQYADKFTILYTGRLYAERTPKYFLEALKSALEEEPGMRKKIEVIFVGSCEEFLDGKRIEEYLKEYNLTDVVKLTGHLSRQESLEYQMRASVLLMIIGIVPPEMELTYGLSGKVFDYILSGKPLLTIANGGATREFIMENKIGQIFYHHDTDGIKRYITEAFNDFYSGQTHIRYDLKKYENFNFKKLTKILSDQLDAKN